MKEKEKEKENKKEDKKEDKKENKKENKKEDKKPNAILGLATGSTPIGLYKILIAKNKQGHEALKKLSTKAWLNSFMDRGMERVVTTYEDLENIVNEYSNSLIAATACLGGELSQRILAIQSAENIFDIDEVSKQKKEIQNFQSMAKCSLTQLFHQRLQKRNSLVLKLQGTQTHLFSLI